MSVLIWTGDGGGEFAGRESSGLSGGGGEMFEVESRGDGGEISGVESSELCASSTGLGDFSEEEMLAGVHVPRRAGPSGHEGRSSLRLPSLLHTVHVSSVEIGRAHV